MAKDQSLEERILEAGISTIWLGQPVHYFPTTDSTNDHLKALARSGKPAGAMIISDYQSQGKGRLNRQWAAPPGTGLLFSLLMKPDWPAQRASWLTMIAGLSVLEAVVDLTGLRTGLKWPNDIVLFHESKWLKLGGILLETQISENMLRQAVVGIGVNVNQVESDFQASSFEAISLRIALGKPLSRFELLKNILLRLERAYDKATTGVSPHREWNQRLISLGKFVSVTVVGTEDVISGTAVETDDRGLLQVIDDDNNVHFFAAGDVTIIS